MEELEKRKERTSNGRTGRDAAPLLLAPSSLSSLSRGGHEKAGGKERAKLSSIEDEEAQNLPPPPSQVDHEEQHVRNEKKKKKNGKKKERHDDDKEFDTCVCAGTRDRDVCVIRKIG